MHNPSRRSGDVLGRNKSFYGWPRRWISGLAFVALGGCKMGHFFYAMQYIRSLITEASTVYCRVMLDVDFFLLLLSMFYIGVG